LPDDRLLIARRRGTDPYATTPFGWYGNDPVFQVLVERDIRQIDDIAGAVRVELRDDRLTYHVPGLQVPGDLADHDLRIEFRPEPLGAWAAGIAPCDYPRVFTSVVRARKHENADGSLCLWASYDPPERRWWHGHGLRALVEITRRHLLLELHWFATGGHKNGNWAVQDAPHGAPDVRDLR
jgi:hypothetical protein